MQLTTHFALHEFRCPCGECKELLTKGVEPPLLIALETVRVHFNRPVIITSGIRCPAYNASIGGAPDSRHMYGDAADFYVRNVLPSRPYGFLEEQPWASLIGLGLYSGHVHLDTRGSKARWLG